MLELSMKPVLIIPLSAIPDGQSIDEFAEQFANHPNKPIIVRDGAEIVPPQYDDILKEVLKYSTYKVGEVVAIAQRYTDIEWRNNPYCEIPDLSFNGQLAKSKGWKNKMYVRADLMPHRIRITNVRIERIQDISDEDCLREGIRKMTFDTFSFDSWKFFTHNPREAFAALIAKLSGKGIWESNPWVFVYEFELVK